MNRIKDSKDIRAREIIKEKLGQGWPLKRAVMFAATAVGRVKRTVEGYWYGG